MRREPKRYVALHRFCEGLIFDQDGSWCDLDRLAKVPSLPIGFTRRDGKIWIDRDAIHEAPKLEGPLIVFYDGRLDRYTDWLTGAMPALDAMSRQAPRNSRLLLPGTLLQMQRRPGAFNHRDMMKLLGFARMPMVESSADLVWADDVIFMDRPTPESIPADQLRDFRDRVLQPFGGPGERIKRLYIKRAGAGGLPERHEIERFLAGQGFEHVQLEHLTHEQQLRLFQEAAYVVSAHGGGLSNLVFSGPGVKVLELMAEDDFRPDFWTLANKLDHIYGFLGCPTAGVPSDMRLTPDFARFRDLFHVLEAYQG
jgi:capsular polysaccharide biosynthesis protein